MFWAEGWGAYPAALQQCGQNWCRGKMLAQTSSSLAQIMMMVLEIWGKWDIEKEVNQRTWQLVRHEQQHAGGGGWWLRDCYRQTNKEDQVGRRSRFTLRLGVPLRQWSNQEYAESSWIYNHGLRKWIWIRGIPLGHLASLEEWKCLQPLDIVLQWKEQRA